MLEAEARERMAQGGRGGSGAEEGREIIPYLGKASEQVAELVGVNPRYISDAKRIKEDAPDVFHEMQAGALTMPLARAL